MRKNRVVSQHKEFSILTLDDDEIMTLTLQSYFRGAGYDVDVENDPTKAIERVRTGHYDILLLDFLMRPICGDEVVRQIREFNRDLFIILLTGHKSMAPPIKTISELDIQGYYEKSDRFDQLELLIESCAKAIRQMRTIRNYQNSLKKILDIVQVFSQQQNLEVVLIGILEHIREIFACPDGFIYLDRKVLDEEEFLKNNSIPCYCGSGYYEGYNEETCALVRQEAGAKILISEDRRIISAALTSQNHKDFGVMQIQLPAAAREEDIQLFDVYVKQAGAIISNLFFANLLQVRNTELNRAYTAMNQSYMETIEVMRQMVDAKDLYTRGHSDRVSYYAVEIGKAMNKDEQYLERLRVAGLFHDVGKLGIPDGILCKESRLTDEENLQIKGHPTLGKKILSTISVFEEILDIVECHHEWYDGSGYPNGTAGESIPEEARIISVADAFDAMTSKRSYRLDMDIQDAVDEIKRGSGTQFDKLVVEVFVGIVGTFDRINEETGSIYLSEIAKKENYYETVSSKRNPLL